MITRQKVGEEAGGKTGGWPKADGIFQGNGSLVMGGPLVNSGAVFVIVCLFTLSLHLPSLKFLRPFSDVLFCVMLGFSLSFWKRQCR